MLDKSDLWQVSSRIRIPVSGWSGALLAELDDEWLTGEVYLTLNR